MALTTEFHANPFIVAFRAGAADDSGAWSPPAKCRVLDAWIVMTQAGTGSDTAQITDGTNAITAALDVSSASDKDIMSLANIDDAHRDLVPGTDTLTSVLAGGAKCDIFVLLAWVD